MVPAGGIAPGCALDFANATLALACGRRMGRDGRTRLAQRLGVFDQLFLTLDVVPWLIYAGVVRLVRGPNQESRIDDPRRMLLLLGSGIVSAALVSPVLQAFIPFESHALPAITERVLAQQGNYWLEPLSPGVRHKVQFEEDPARLL